MAHSRCVMCGETVALSTEAGPGVKFCGCPAKTFIQVGRYEAPWTDERGFRIEGFLAQGSLLGGVETDTVGLCTFARLDADQPIPDPRPVPEGC